MSIAAIPGLNVTQIDKNKYAVSVDNGNYGAAVINKAQLKELADTYGVPLEDKKSTVKKVLAGVAVAGAVAAGVVYRKNIGKFFKGLFNGKNADKLKDAVANSKKSAANLYDRVAEFLGKTWNKTKNLFKGVYSKVGNKVKTLFGKKVEDRISYGPLKNKVMKETADDIVKNFNNNNSAIWLKTFRKRYPHANIELMSRR